MSARLPRRQLVGLPRAAMWMVPLAALVLTSAASGQGQYHWQPEIWHGNRRVTPEPGVPVYGEHEYVARQIIAEAQQRVRARDFHGARRLAEIASQLHVVWQTHEETPQSLLRLLQSIPPEAWEAAGPEFITDSSPASLSTSSTDSADATEAITAADQVVPTNQLRASASRADSAAPSESLPFATTTTAPAFDADPHEFARASFTRATPEERQPWPTSSARAAPPEWTHSSQTPISYEQAVELFHLQARDTRQGDSALGTLSSFTLGFLFALAALVIVALFFLRGLSARDGAIFRVELVNTGSPLIQHQALMQPYGPPGVAPAEPVEELPDSEPPPFPFESVGPTFAERQRQAEEQMRRTEEAMLKHIFEQNVQLRQDLLALQPAV